MLSPKLELLTIDDCNFEVCKESNVVVVVIFLSETAANESGREIIN